MTLYEHHPLCNCNRNMTAREMQDIYLETVGPETVLNAASNRAILAKRGVEQKTLTQRKQGYRARKRAICDNEANVAEEYCLLPQLVEDFKEKNPGE